MEFAGRHVLVSGGGSGVGAAIALAFADTGARVTITGRREAPLREMAARHDRIGWATCDVTDAEAVRAMLADVTRDHGAPGIVVANAGAAQSKPFHRMSADDLDAMLAVNLRGVFNLWQSALPGMKGQGRLIAIASTAALKGYAYVAGYVAAKHAVLGLTRALALELAQSGVTVNAVCPGFTETPLLERSIETIMQSTGRSREDAQRALYKGNPQQRFVQPAEVANAVLWLAGDGAGAVTGQAISVSGGET